MYIKLFQDIMGFISVTDNPLIDTVILIIIAKILHLIVFRLVGDLYQEDFISGSIAGKIMYLIIWAVFLIPAALVLWLIGRVIWLVELISA